MTGSVGESYESEDMNAPILWDFAGFDGLALARDLFGSAVSELGVYQSLETEWRGAPCALLRLCENNFRVGFSADAGSVRPAGWEDTLKANTDGRRVWAKPSMLASIFLEEGPPWEQLGQIGTTKAPHRLAGLPCHRAVPAQIAGRAALVWRHSVEGASVVEIQTAPADCAAIRKSLGEGFHGHSHC